MSGGRRSQTGATMDKLPQEKAQRAIALTLRYGATASTLIMAIGVALSLLHRPLPSLMGAPTLGRALSFGRLWGLEPQAVTEVGIVFLLLTPVFRIMVATVGFALERDFRYVLISLGVLAVVLVSVGFAVG